MHLSEYTNSNRSLWRNKGRGLLANPPLQARVKGNHQLNHGGPGQRQHQAPIHLWKLYVEAVIESEVRPAVVQLKSEA